MPPTYLRTLSAFTQFLTAYTHTLLYLRTLYPRTSFVHSRFHNTPVYQSRHPEVCEWIRDAITAVRHVLLSGTVSRLAIVVYSYDPDGKAAGSAKIMERYMLDVSAFPVVEKDQLSAEIEWDEADNEEEDEDEDDEDDEEEEEEEEDEEDEEKEDDEEGVEEKQKAPDTDIDVDLSEQFRAAFVALTSRCAQLAPLPPHCSFNISMELKDEGDADPPMAHPQSWIPIQPSLQKTGRKDADADKSAVGRQEGEDLGGAKTTPIRTVEAGVFRFETWIEEGRAKFETLNKDMKPSLGSSVG
jgi:mitotic spindle assembly checkpoint protein MAD2B